MCGMNWYREEMERAEEDLDRLTQLLAMMEERYKLPLAEPDDSNRLSPDIVDVYLELVSRKKALTMNKSPQA
ncbi:MULTISPECIES: hypothetical protein [Sporomusa]|jgi:hypothetical protein|uniref:Spo0E like sporulation regulatory protein n=1 Tax=Sporomusa sphaeroides DSM 2875 TaxID=1337886 RepID=A0ABM9WAH9_9FIRM|nr:hypothetical protein [Sporomusa sphaeroides]OLS56260.1 hypothetical protein SPSPH_26510 [Sporomusa sphaeroides DSM 2875]CVK21744.1 hypothetical protein SSPH_04453 [Sporomusa sphaeroides DSM 2875]HML33925.1 hypothetical protein [Sporomusa sphaeroides]